MMVLPENAKTLKEIHHSEGLRLRDGANSIYGIRVDGIPKAPDNYYLPRDISKY